MGCLPISGGGVNLGDYGDGNGGGKGDKIDGVFKGEHGYVVGIEGSS